jgi:DNA-binding NarL/FixJ family response regulator
MSIKVLIVDDHAVVRQGIKALLTAYPNIQVLGEAADGETTLHLAQVLQPDVILLDLLMPGMSGVAVLKKLKEKANPAKVLILTSSLEETLVNQAISAGANGYVLKAIRAGDLVTAIIKVAEGQTTFDAAATRILAQKISSGDPLQSLTLREKEVFEQLARGLSNPEIAAKLQIGEATVRTHIASVLEKLSLRDRTQVTIFALKHSLIKIEDLP